VRARRSWADEVLLAGGGEGVGVGEGGAGGGDGLGADGLICAGASQGEADGVERELGEAEREGPGGCRRRGRARGRRGRRGGSAAVAGGLGEGEVGAVAAAELRPEGEGAAQLGDRVARVLARETCPIGQEGAGAVAAGDAKWRWR
jgi:hypothetical protein